MKVVTQPYKHFTEQAFFLKKDFDTIIKNLHLIKWNVEVQDEFTFYFGETIPTFEERTNEILSKYTQKGFIETLSLLFDVHLDTCLSVVFFKMTKGYAHKTHSDDNSFGEKVRIVCYLSDLSSYEGGELNLHYDNHEKAITKSLRMPINSAFGFLMTGNSYHSVSEVFNGERITLIFTYGTN